MGRKIEYVTYVVLTCQKQKNLSTSKNLAFENIGQFFHEFLEGFTGFQIVLSLPTSLGQALPKDCWSYGSYWSPVDRISSSCIIIMRHHASLSINIMRHHASLSIIIIRHHASLSIIIMHTHYHASSSCVIIMHHYPSSYSSS